MEITVFRFILYLFIAAWVGFGISVFFCSAKRAEKLDELSSTLEACRKELKKYKESLASMKMMYRERATNYRSLQKKYDDLETYCKSMEQSMLTAGKIRQSRQKEEEYDKKD